MKLTTLIFGLTLLINQSLQSQDYVPFPTENVKWNVLLIYGGMDETPDSTLLRYSINGNH